MFGFLGLIAVFVIGAVTVVLMPFALLYSIGYLSVLIYLFIVYLKNRPEEAKETFRQFVDYYSDPKIVHESYVRRSRKFAAKRRKKQIRRSKRKARHLIYARVINKSIRDILR